MNGVRRDAPARQIVICCVPLEELLAEAGCNEGENRALAEQQLAEAESAGLLVRVPVHKRDRSHIHQIRFPAINEDALYTKIARLSPTKTRAKLAEQFTAAATTDIPTRWREKWAAWCGRMRNEALAGRSIAAFDREPSRANDQTACPASEIAGLGGRIAHAIRKLRVCGSSKQLEQLAALERDGEFSGQLRGKLGRLLEEITGGEIRTLDDIGILSKPTFRSRSWPAKTSSGWRMVGFRDFAWAFSFVSSRH